MLSFWCKLSLDCLNTLVFTDLYMIAQAMLFCVELVKVIVIIAKQHEGKHASEPAERQCSSSTGKSKREGKRNCFEL